MTTDIAVPDDNNEKKDGLAMPEEWAALAGAFDDGSSRFVEHFGTSMPRLRSDFGRNGKGWIDDLTGETLRQLDAVILAYPPSRAWWEKTIDEGGGGGRPDCSSLDMIAPLPNSPKRQSPMCGDCPHSKWGDDGERPRCAESVNVLAFDRAHERFVWVRFAGTGLKPFRDYVSALASRRLPTYAATAVITLEERKDGAMEWLVPKFGIGEFLTPADVAPMRTVAAQAMASWQQVADEMASQQAGPFDEAVDAKARVAEAFGADGAPFVDAQGEEF